MLKDDTIVIYLFTHDFVKIEFYSLSKNNDWIKHKKRIKIHNYRNQIGNFKSKINIIFNMINRHFNKERHELKWYTIENWDIYNVRASYRRLYGYKLYQNYLINFDNIKRMAWAEQYSVGFSSNYFGTNTQKRIAWEK